MNFTDKMDGLVKSEKITDSMIDEFSLLKNILLNISDEEEYKNCFEQHIDNLLMSLCSISITIKFCEQTEKLKKEIGEKNG